jgi:NAD(P)-dependent dehydrogenase (short-subunit alcohol dehydrogenase family)
MSLLKSLWTQTFPSRPVLTGSNLPRQTGKVFIVTGGSSGIGYELAKILYSAGATVYIMTRNASKAADAIQAIEASCRDGASAGAGAGAGAEGSTSANPPGVVRFLHLDLADLSSIPASAAAFRAASSRLDVLWNNAGVASAPMGSRTAQGLDPHLGINCVGPFLFTQLLLPTLISTARQTTRPDDDKNSSVRIIWSSSMLVDAIAPKGGPSRDRNRNYAASKSGNWFLASEYARRLGRGHHPIVSITQNPGNLNTDVWRTTPRLIYWLSRPVLGNPVNGAHTALWAGLSPDVSLADGGRCVIPYGRWHPCPSEDILAALRDKDDDGGTGAAGEFWNWCERQVRPYVD